VCVCVCVWIDIRKRRREYAENEKKREEGKEKEIWNTNTVLNLLSIAEYRCGSIYSDIPWTGTCASVCTT